MNFFHSIIEIKTERGPQIRIIPFGDGNCYAVRGDLYNDHHYTLDYSDPATLASDIISGKVQWIEAEGHSRHYRA